MKSIILNTARLDNSGARHDAGDEIAIGNGKTQIDAETAASWVKGRLAIDAAKVPDDAEKPDAANPTKAP